MIRILTLLGLVALAGCGRTPQEQLAGRWHDVDKSEDYCFELATDGTWNSVDSKGNLKKLGTWKLVSADTFETEDTPERAKWFREMDEKEMALGINDPPYTPILRYNFHFANGELILRFDFKGKTIEQKCERVPMK